jgi:ParB/RepB/Spo0J family partition protein
MLAPCMAKSDQCQLKGVEMAKKRNWFVDAIKAARKQRLKKSRAKKTSKRVFSNRAPSFDVSKVKIAEIQIIGKRRPLNKAKLRVIADSMSKIGLRTPLTVHKHDDDKIVLDTGLHRLEAAKSLGWKEIDCIVMEGGKVQRQLWTVAENLHRADLTKLQRAEAVTQWGQLIKELDKDGQVAHPGGKQPHDKGVSKVAKGLGVTRETVRRSGKIARISPSAKAAAEAAGLAGNEDALLKVAKEPTPEAQVKKVAELAAKFKAAAKKSSGTKRAGTSKANSLSAEEEKVLKKLIEAWTKADELKRAFIKASPNVRKQFLANICEEQPPRKFPHGWVK